MSRCVNCGVEIEDSDVCPLCGTPARPDSGQSESGRPHPGGSPRTTEEPAIVRDAKIWLFEMVSLVSFTAAIIVFAADFAFGFRVTWSVFPLSAIVFLWLFTSAIIALFRFPVGLVIAETILVGGFLLALNQFAGGEPWFISLALPITGLVGLIVAVEVLVIRLTRASPLQAVAVTFLGTGLFLVGLELILNNYLGREAPVSWSLVAFACTVSLFFLILFINRRLREHHSEFKKIFHV